MKVTMRIFEYLCGNCGLTYRSPQSTGAYGVVVFRDACGRHLAALNAIDDPLFDRVGEAIRGHPAGVDNSDRRLGQAAQYVVGRLSDPSPDGHPYDVSTPPACSNCGATMPVRWASVEPPQFVEMEVHELGRTRWDSMSPGEQVERLTEVVNDALTVL